MTIQVNALLLERKEFNHLYLIDTSTAADYIA